MTSLRQSWYTCEYGTDARKAVLYRLLWAILDASGNMKFVIQTAASKNPLRKNNNIVLRSLLHLAQYIVDLD